MICFLRRVLGAFTLTMARRTPLLSPKMWYKRYSVSIILVCHIVVIIIIMGIHRAGA